MLSAWVQMTKLPLRQCCGALIMVFGTLASNAYAADRGVTSITVAGQAIGNSPQYATATISIFCPGPTGTVVVYPVNNNQVLNGSGSSGSFSLAYSGVPCGGSLTVHLFGQYEVRAAGQYQFGACVNGFQDCFGEATAWVTVAPATYTITSKKRHGTTTYTMVRTPATSSAIWYNLGNSQCNSANVALNAGQTTLVWATNAVIYNCGPTGYGTWSGIDSPPHFPINGPWTPQLRLRGAIDTAALGSLVTLSGAVAHVPMGSTVTFVVTDEYGQLQTADFALGLATVESGLEPSALFPNHVAFRYANHGPSDRIF